MTVNKVIWLAFMWISATIICLTLNGQTIGGSSLIDQINALSSLQIISESNTTIFGIFNNVIAYFSAFFNMLTFNYSFFTGGWVIVRYILLAITIGMVFGLMQIVFNRKTG